jgi:hypothetical protein
MTNSNAIWRLQVTRNLPLDECQASISNVPDLAAKELELTSTFSPDVPRTGTAPQPPEQQDSTSLLHRSRYGE